AYRVLRVLGVGGMGVVFEAEDTLLKRVVALKAMKPDLAASPVQRQRFLREAQAIAQLDHEHVVAVHQVGEDRGVPFLAMPLLRGETLEAWLQAREGGSVPVSEVLRIGREVAEGLAAAHRRGLTHRDIKPANIFLEGMHAEETAETVVGPQPAVGRVKILDFGLARPAEDADHLTQTGVVAGTPRYMAPEQVSGAKVDHRADLFSLGCVLYRMTTGRLPFTGENTLAALRALAVEVPKSPRTLNPAVPAALSDLVMRLLAKEPS